MLYTAFIMGLIGSLHCVGMCGPIALMLPGNKEKRTRFIMGRLLYNSGRVLTYGIFGIGIGYFGEKIETLTSSSLLSLVLGSALLAGILVPAKLLRRFSPDGFIRHITQKIKSFVALLFKKHFMGVQFVFGLVNGLLPCGMVYAALSGAFLTAGPSEGFLFMVLFGIGTVPAMLGLSLGSTFFRGYFRLHFSKLIHITYGVLAIWLIVRGFYFQQSPAEKDRLSAAGITICH